VYYVKAVVDREKTLKEKVFRRKKRAKTSPEYGLFVVATADPRGAGCDADGGGSLAQELAQQKKTKAGGVAGLFGKPLYCSAKVRELRWLDSVMVLVVNLHVRLIVKYLVGLLSL
jgi:hypothetical protein